MRIKLISFIIILTCLLSVLFAGVFSVHRSEGKVLPDDVRVQVESFIQQLTEEWFTE